jgi:hypothetical protein
VPPITTIEIPPDHYRRDGDYPQVKGTGNGLPG